MRISGDGLLILLQQFIDRPAQIKEIHCCLIVSGYLLLNSAAAQPPPRISRWLPTLLFNSLIRSYSHSGQPFESLMLFTYMLACQAPPNSMTFPPVIKSAVSLRRQWGPALHAQTIGRGVSWDPFVKTSFINFYARVGQLVDAEKVFDEISRPCLVARNAMLDALCKNGEVRSAVNMFDSMPEHDVVSWTSLVSGLSSNGFFYEAIHFFSNMNLRPNEATYMSVLSSCANFQGQGGLCIGKQIHSYIVRHESELTTFIGTALVDLYGKTGCLAYSRRVFDQMDTRKVCTWNAMISSLSCNGEENLALGMFDEMVLGGWKPNSLTFVAVLTACARGQLVESGLELYRLMSEGFGLEPMMEHYGCVVDLLGRAGLLGEAIEFMESMPFEPDDSVLGALLAACKIPRAVDLSKRLGRKLLGIQHTNICGKSVLLSNIHAESREWNSAADVRKAMAESGTRKIPAFSMLDSL
ncbi:hypothetical protein SAY87_009381 [Trapa incisa]|uniref:Pentatricopeptide repeat-containing protein n=1 Tax=Trapa incisa TaxID=236973 RepID=A0AAN7JZJ2_9MYRT|nr:hypothetical protein SAY87_009381 [Trapa incisa]